MKKRKTKGSSMLLVIAVFGILSIIGTSMLAATTSSYKLRIEENNRIKRFYGAESGVDKAYIKLVDQVNEAIKVGHASKTEFVEKYVEYIENTLPGNVSGKYMLSNGEEADITCFIEPGEGQNKKATLESIFMEDEKVREVKVTYSIIVPTSYSNVDNTININNTGMYSLATDGDLVITNDGVKKDLSIDGQVWVRGSRSTDIYRDPINHKYKGGIDINNSNVAFKDNVNTASNICLDNNAQLSINNEDGKNNIFAENILLGNVSRANEKSSVRLDASSANIYLANDLVISSSDAEATINNFYGFNDAKVVKAGEEVRGSSSIIVNSMNWPTVARTPSLTVRDKAYIMGSAYIKTNNSEYQTGESVALKGNYVAYTAPEDGKYDKSGYVYLDPLVLIDSIDGKELNVVDKAELFKNYSEDEANRLKLKTNGIKLPKNTKEETNTYTVGASISENSVNGHTYSVDIDNEVRELKSSFVRSVYFMNDFNGGQAESDKQFNLGKPSFTVNNQVNWDDIRLLLESGENYYSGEVNDINLIVNYDPSYNDKEYEQIKNRESLIKISNDKITLKNLSGNDYTIDIDRDKEYVLITNGSVNVEDINYIDGLKCKILSVGDITIKNCSGIIGSDNTSPIIGSSGNSSIVAQELISKEKWTLVK